MDNLGLASVGGLRKIEIGPGDKPRPTYVRAKSNLEYKPELVDLLKGI